MDEEEDEEVTIKKEKDRRSVKIFIEDIPARASEEHDDDRDRIKIKPTETDDSDYIIFKNLLLASKNADKEMMFGKKKYMDNYDLVSEDPSYTNFEIPYVVKCRMRYARKCRNYDKQFKKEIGMLEIFQQNAYEAARFSRHLGMTTLWPPLHNRREVNKFVQSYFVHTPKNRKRLLHLLSEPQT